MKRIADIRRALAEIPGTFDGLEEPGWSDRGEILAVWDALDGELSQADLGNRVSESSGLTPIVELPSEFDEDVSLPLVDPSVGGALRQRSLALGVEALAWYMPFHQSAYQWGCYLSLRGILTFADLFLPLSLPGTRRVQLAMNLLLRHELTHFSIEYAVAQWELSVLASSYWPGRRGLRDQSLGFIKLDEKAANAYMLRGLRYPSGIMRTPGALEIVRNYTSQMPPGYSDGQFFVDRPRFEDLLRDVADDYSLSMWPPQRRAHAALDRLGFYPNRGERDPRHVPIFIVSDTSGIRVPSAVFRFIPNITEIKESPRFARMLSKQTPHTRRAWTKTLEKIARSSGLNGLDFKPWRDGGPNVFSMRVTGSVRAHIRLRREENVWEAIGIGSHDQMDH